MDGKPKAKIKCLLHSFLRQNEKSLNSSLGGVAWVCFYCWFLPFRRFVTIGSDFDVQSCTLSGYFGFFSGDLTFKILLRLENFNEIEGVSFSNDQ